MCDGRCVVARAAALLGAHGDVPAELAYGGRCERARRSYGGDEGRHRERAGGAD